MTRDRFQVVGESLTGHGVAFDLARLGVGRDADKLGALTDMANVVYQQGRDSALLSRDDRFDLHGAVDALRALAVIVGPTSMGDRYRRSADVVAELLRDQEGR